MRLILEVLRYITKHSKVQLMYIIWVKIYEHHDISDHWICHILFNHLIRLQTYKTSKLYNTLPLLKEIHPKCTVDFSHKAQWCRKYLHAITSSCHFLGHTLFVTESIAGAINQLKQLLLTEWQHEYLITTQPQWAPIHYTTHASLSLHLASNTENICFSM